MATYQKTSSLPAPDGDDGDGAGLEWPKLKDPNSRPPPQTSFVSVAARRKTIQVSLDQPGLLTAPSVSYTGGGLHAPRRHQVAPEPTARHEAV